MQQSMTDAFKACAQAGVPIVAIQTTDQSSTISQLKVLYEAKRAIWRWDVVNGILPVNDRAERYSAQIGADPALTSNPVEALRVAQKMPTASILFMANIPLALDVDQLTLTQSIANTRDEFKKNQRILVLLGPSFSFGPELVRDVIVIDEPLPSQDAIAETVTQQFINAKLPDPPPETVLQASKILLGSNLFEAEQLTATSILRTGLDFDLLWRKKELMVGQTPGMSLWSGRETWSDIGGLAQWKLRLQRIINGRADIGLIMFFDEVEKMFGGATSDTSGVSQDFHGQFLSWSQDNEILGAILAGCSGAGKSLSSKAAGTSKASGRIPVLSCDVGAMKSSLVGSSEARFRNFLKTARALTPSRILILMTCNDLTTLSPELKARMTLGTFFFDQPSEEERSSIWPIYLRKYNHGTSYDDVPPELRDRAWTGREIKACCETAWNEQIDLMEASQTIVPVSITDADRMNRLREIANNSFLSVTYPGPYMRARLEEPSGSGVRAIETDAWE